MQGTEKKEKMVTVIAGRPTVLRDLGEGKLENPLQLTMGNEVEMTESAFEKARKPRIEGTLMLATAENRKRVKDEIDEKRAMKKAWEDAMRQRRR